MKKKTGKKNNKKVVKRTNIQPLDCYGVKPTGVGKISHLGGVFTEINVDLGGQW